MSHFSRLQVYAYMQEFPIVPLLSSDDINDSLKIMDACYKGGVRVFEFTNRGDFAHEIFSALV